MISSQEFYRNLRAYRGQSPELRYGQSVFNVMYKLDPHAVVELCGTDLDPYYNDDVVDDFIEVCLYKGAGSDEHT